MKTRKLQKQLQVSPPGERAATMKARIDQYHSDLDGSARYIAELEELGRQLELEATFLFRFKRFFNHINKLFSRKH
jgi:hypothetical protein